MTPRVAKKQNKNKKFNKETNKQTIVNITIKKTFPVKHMKIIVQSKKCSINT